MSTENFTNVYSYFKMAVYKSSTCAQKMCISTYISVDNVDKLKKHCIFTILSVYNYVNMKK
ncbi:hypothetical protein GCM10011351_27160 [Paraliobacillus quinghaiensis]|uniref:Uncharacterized protein n=1 Tax=Paraliobacillus quinghaiensis TaxID=470815 RepID=A0A917WXV9_9BACI|nr:hypothetical protein GCM10011351_27160 [Paraliobacillus quinghaiensis]